MTRFIFALLACVHAVDVPLKELTDENVYVTSIAIGTPAQNFSLLVSTGQPYLWVANKECSNCGLVDPKPYDHGLSSSYEKDGSKFSDDDSAIVDGSQNQGVSGYMSKDVVSFGDGLAGRVKFGEATEARPFDFVEGIDGVLGMGRHSKTGNFVEQLAAQKTIPKAVAGISLDGGVGELSLGAPDESKYDASTLTTLSAMDSPRSANAAFKNFWRVPINGMALNGKPLDTVSQSTGVVLNTAAFEIYAPEREARAIANSIPMASWYGKICIVPIDAKFSITFSFGMGMDVTLTEKDLVMKNPLFGRQYGVLYLVADDRAQGWVLGTQFLEKVYTVINYSDDTVSLAEKKEQKVSATAATTRGTVRLPLATGRRSLVDMLRNRVSQEEVLHV